jgi:hypothetical protein
MVLPLVADVYQVSTLGTLYGKPCDHVINWHVTGGAATHGGKCVELGHADHDNWITAFEHVAGPGYVYKGSVVKYLGDTTTAPFDLVESFAGVSTGVRVPAFCAVTCRHKYNGRGRGKDGRTNFPNIVIDLVDPADAYSLTGSGLAEMQSLFDTYLAGVASSMAADTGTIADLVILDRKLGTFSVPLSSLVDPYLNTHRRWAKRLARH